MSKVNFQVTYHADTSVQIYIDNTMVGEDTVAETAQDVTTFRSGHIVIGKYLVNNDDNFGQLTVDWLTIWDRVLTQQERNLAHLV